MATTSQVNRFSSAPAARLATVSDFNKSVFLGHQWIHHRKLLQSCALNRIRASMIWKVMYAEHNDQIYAGKRLRVDLSCKTMCHVPYEAQVLKLLTPGYVEIIPQTISSLRNYFHCLCLASKRDFSLQLYL